MTGWADPLTYPGDLPGISVLVTPVGHHRLEPGAAGTLLAGRRPVLAVGSNRSPAVLRAKLADAGLEPFVPLMVARVANLRVAVSAHVSRPGFVPAAPADLPGEVSRVSLCWFDDGQLAAIDATEATYDRIGLDPARHPVTPDGPGASLPAVDVYVSRRGVLRDGAGPRRLGPQAELARWLAGRGIAPWCDHPPRRAARRLAGSARLRERAGRDLAAAGLVIGDGLARGDAAGAIPPR